MTLPDIAPPLLRWYEQNKRTLPFRTVSTPYRVWVSEIMLQQTRVSAALPYFERFMAELPTVADLAACDPERLHKLGEGLGYYSRVRNLQKAAQIVMEQHGGALPADYDALLKLPGVGAYTAGAIASISFGLPVPAVDGNVLRVFARILNDGRDVTRPDVKKDLTACVMELQPPERPGDYNQALMEGAPSAIQTEQALAALGVTARAVEPLSPARHVFSHLVWEMDGFACAAQSCAPPPGCVWAGRAEVDGVYTLPGAFKAYRLALKKYL